MMAAGSVNFLSDKSFEPYATLDDVCWFFGANNSTVGNKAGHIRKTLGMDRLNTEYLFNDSPLVSMLDSLCVTEDGIIVFKENIKEEEEYIEDDGQIDKFIITGYAKKPIKYTRCLQYEYLFNQMAIKWTEAGGRERRISLRWEELQYLTVEVSCTLTEAGELEERIRKEGFE